jgi:hypothetical protein
VKHALNLPVGMGVESVSWSQISSVLDWVRALVEEAGESVSLEDLGVMSQVSASHPYDGLEQMGSSVRWNIMWACGFYHKPDWVRS